MKEGGYKKANEKKKKVEIAKKISGGRKESESER